MRSKSTSLQPRDARATSIVPADIDFSQKSFQTLLRHNSRERRRNARALSHRAKLHQVACGIESLHTPALHIQLPTHSVEGRSLLPWVLGVCEGVSSTPALSATRITSHALLLFHLSQFEMCVQ